MQKRGCGKMRESKNIKIRSHNNLCYCPHGFGYNDGKCSMRHEYLPDICRIDDWPCCPESVEAYYIPTNVFGEPVSLYDDG